jgi:hypothetical protein
MGDVLCTMWGRKNINPSFNLLNWKFYLFFQAGGLDSVHEKNLK